jgi:membrane fusion protein (multidrug efflux system)
MEALLILHGTIYSPVNGVIGSLPFKEGSLVSPTAEMIDNSV